MKYRTNLMTLITLLITFNAIHSQGLDRSEARELTIGIGASLVGIKDDRLSALKHRTWAPSYLIGYKKISATTKQEFLFGLSMDMSSNNQRLLKLQFIRPAFSYSLEKKVEGIWIGGSFNHNTLLTFPSSQTGHFNNNPISYTIANSIGPKVSWMKGFDVDHQEKLVIDGSIEAAILSYVIRPAYAHPYPEQFLESGTFTPTKDGMAGPLLRSGKVFSLGKFQSFKVVLGLSYFINDHIKVGMNLRFDYARTADINTSTISSQDIMFKLSYQY